MILPAFTAPYAPEPGRRTEGVFPSRVAGVRETRASGGIRPWEVPERFAAEFALRDLPGCAGDAEATERVVARFVVARIAAWDPLVAADPEGEHASARAYLSVLPAAAERNALENVLRAAAAGRPWLLAVSLREAGELAGAAGHRGGAYLLLRHAFAVARHAAARGEAARAARGIAELAREAAAGNVARAWAARAKRLERAAADPAAIMHGMAEGYTREQRAALERAVREREALRCPACGERVVESRVAPRADVAYVRRRIWLLCSGCRRSASLDVTGDGRS